MSLGQYSMAARDDSKLSESQMVPHLPPTIVYLDTKPTKRPPNTWRNPLDNSPRTSRSPDGPYKRENPSLIASGSASVTKRKLDHQADETHQATPDIAKKPKREPITPEAISKLISSINSQTSISGFDTARQGPVRSTGATPPSIKTAADAPSMHGPRVERAAVWDRTIRREVGQSNVSPTDVGSQGAYS